MEKATALALLGGSSPIAGQRVGCTAQAIRKWPAQLPARLVDRVIAAVVRDLVDSQRVPGKTIKLPPDLVRHLRSHHPP
jgi:transcriptional repressor of cell division inhibition gene dicB